MPPSAGSVLAYELTHSIATKGAIRQSAMTTRKGVITGLFTSVDSGMGGSVPSRSPARWITWCCGSLGNAQEI
ncbi:hypothetical protein GCM10010331_01080 [Streptomyces xanthochromogenes]|nr:hypothetical protein GCM10010331_01080 [Streptomyces xanthochromogenes]